jgi:hypothetical protein
MHAGVDLCDFFTVLLCEVRRSMSSEYRRCRSVLAHGKYSILKYSVNSAVEAMYSDFDASLGGCLQEIKKLLMNNESNCEEAPLLFKSSLNSGLPYRDAGMGKTLFTLLHNQTSGSPP